jgi:transposase
MREIWSRAQVNERGRIFLAASVGEMSVAEACEKLGISRQRFHKLEDRAVEGFLRALAPRAAGRPPKAQGPTAALARKIEELKRENKKLWLYVKVLQKLAGIEPGGKKAGRRAKAARGGGKAHGR